MPYPGSSSSPSPAAALLLLVLLLVASSPAYSIQAAYGGVPQAVTEAAGAAAVCGSRRLLAPPRDTPPFPAGAPPILPVVVVVWQLEVDRAKRARSRAEAPSGPV
ncbi:hypothetical protein PVAP13_5NG076000 [Panicum virgatum]|nr:hypothetical protein PVAP13_5NG076000 [Panicum virgatum]